MTYLLLFSPVLLCAGMGALMGLDYALTSNERAKVLAIRWFKRMGVFLVISLLLLLLHLGGAV